MDQRVGTIAAGIESECPQSLLNLVARAQRLVSSLYSRQLETIGLTDTQLLILAAIEIEPGLNQTEIVARTGVDRSTVADVLLRLELRGLVERYYGVVDSRTKKSYPTGTAYQLLRQAELLSVNVDAQIHQIVPREHWDSFVLALMALSDAHKSGVVNPR